MRAFRRGLCPYVARYRRRISERHRSIYPVHKNRRCLHICGGSAERAGPELLLSEYSHPRPKLSGGSFTFLRGTPLFEVCHEFFLRQTRFSNHLLHASRLPVEFSPFLLGPSSRCRQVITHRFPMAADSYGSTIFQIPRQIFSKFPDSYCFHCRILNLCTYVYTNHTTVFVGRISKGLYGFSDVPMPR